MRRPTVIDGVPLCQSDCPQHDGKRCKETGFIPYAVCAPQVKAMSVVIAAAREFCDDGNDYNGLHYAMEAYDRERGEG